MPFDTWLVQEGLAESQIGADGNEVDRAAG